MRIKIEYFKKVTDEYPIDDDAAHRLLDHFWSNSNVKSVTFIRVCDEG